MRGLLCFTYTDGEHRPHFVHGVAVSSLTDISDVISASRQSQLPVDELGEGLHASGTATDTHKLHRGEHRQIQRSQSSYSSVVEDNVCCRGAPPTLMSPNISGRLCVLVPRLKW